MKFPQKIYVRREVDGNESYLVADTTLFDCLGEQHAAEIATYELVETVRAKRDVVTDRPRKVKR